MEKKKIRIITLLEIFWKVYPWQTEVVYDTLDHNGVPR